MYTREPGFLERLDDDWNRATKLINSRKRKAKKLKRFLLNQGFARRKMPYVVDPSRINTFALKYGDFFIDFDFCHNLWEKREIGKNNIVGLEVYYWLIGNHCSRLSKIFSEQGLDEKGYGLCCWEDYTCVSKEYTLDLAHPTNAVTFIKEKIAEMDKLRCELTEL